MPRHKVATNSYILTAFFQACSGVTLTSQEIEAAFGAAASYRASQPANAFVYTALLTFCAKKAPDRALDVWHALLEVMRPLLSVMICPCDASALSMCPALPCPALPSIHHGLLVLLYLVLPLHFKAMSAISVPRPWDEVQMTALLLNLCCL